MLRPKLLSIIAIALLGLCPLLPLHSQQNRASILIMNAQIADGTGSPLRKGNVRIASSHILGIGELQPEAAETAIDAHGLVLAPGFIDIHNHSPDGLPQDPVAETQISQGITTLIVGADGDSPWPLINWVRQQQQKPAAVNVGVLAGHATIREQVLGKDFKRVSTPEEIQRMSVMVDQAMNQQALGLSSGLEYEVGSYSATEELIAMAKVAAQHGGFYMTHIRDEADKSFEALQEEIAIGEKAHIPLQHSHIKLGTVAVWGKAPQYIHVLEQARSRGIDFLADCYPYDAWKFADLVLFDAGTVIDHSTYTDPTALSTGIEKVFVNGILVWDAGKATGAKPGSVIGVHGAVSQLLN